MAAINPQNYNCGKKKLQMLQKNHQLQLRKLQNLKKPDEKLQETCSCNVAAGVAKKKQLRKTKYARKLYETASKRLQKKTAASKQLRKTAAEKNTATESEKVEKTTKSCKETSSCRS